MTQAISEKATAFDAAPSFAEQLKSFAPSEIRQAIAYWVEQDRMDMAEALVAAGLAMYPESEDILVISALIAEMNQDWAQAQDCLEQLLRLQGQAAGSETYYHLVRVMRCRAAYHQALVVSQKGLAAHPEHPGLTQECAELTDLLDAIPVTVVPAVAAK